MHAYMHAYMHTHTCMLVYLHAHVRTCLSCTPSHAHIRLDHPLSRPHTLAYADTGFADPEIQGGGGRNDAHDVKGILLCS